MAVALDGTSGDHKVASARRSRDADYPRRRLVGVVHYDLRSNTPEPCDA